MSKDFSIVARCEPLRAEVPDDAAKGFQVTVYVDLAVPFVLSAYRLCKQTPLAYTGKRWQEKQQRGWAASSPQDSPDGR